MDELTEIIETGQAGEAGPVPSGGEIAVRAEPSSMLALIARAATDPAVDVAKMEALLRMQRELEADQARAMFNHAFARLLPALPRVKKNGTIEYADKAGKKGAAIRFARWEDIDAVIRPLLAREGFALSFHAAQRQGDGGGLVVTARLRHQDGHADESSIPVPLDTSGGKNNLQAYGSALSYGKRYAAAALLNLVFEGEDDDGVRGGKDYISAEQLREIDELRRELEVDLDGFCRRLAVESLVDLEQPAFPIAMNMLHALKARREARP